MNKGHKIKRSAVTGRFATKPLGRSKASKFAQIEGMTLTRRSAKMISRLEGTGLKGDALRTAITGSFGKKHG